MHAIHSTYIDAVQLMHACLNLGAGNIEGGGGVQGFLTKIQGFRSTSLSRLASMMFSP